MQLTENNVLFGLTVAGVAVALLVGGYATYTTVLDTQRSGVSVQAGGNSSTETPSDTSSPRSTALPTTSQAETPASTESPTKTPTSTDTERRPTRTTAATSTRTVAEQSTEIPVEIESETSKASTATVENDTSASSTETISRTAPPATTEQSSPTAPSESTGTLQSEQLTPSSTPTENRSTSTDQYQRGRQTKRDYSAVLYEHRRVQSENTKAPSLRESRLTHAR